MVRQHDPMVGAEYTLVDPDAVVVETDSVVPIEYDDTGNLVVEHYVEGSEEPIRTIPWNETFFQSLVVEEALVER